MRIEESYIEGDTEQQSAAIYESTMFSLDTNVMFPGLHTAKAPPALRSPFKVAQPDRESPFADLDDSDDMFSDSVAVCHRTRHPRML